MRSNTQSAFVGIVMHISGSRLVLRTSQTDVIAHPSHILFKAFLVPRDPGTATSDRVCLDSSLHSPLAT